jgi:hypothetical protein
MNNDPTIQIEIPNRLLKNVHLLRFPYPSSLRRTSKYASFLRISGALHLGIFEQPEKFTFSATCETILNPIQAGFSISCFHPLLFRIRLIMC